MNRLPCQMFVKTSNSWIVCILVVLASMHGDESTEAQVPETSGLETQGPRAVAALEFPAEADEDSQVESVSTDHALGHWLDLDGWLENDQPIESEHFLRETSPLRQASLLQPTPFVETRVAITPTATSLADTNSLASRVFDNTIAERSLLGQARSQIDTLGVDYVRGIEASSVVATDVGSLLRKSPAALSIEVQRRSPIVNDTRVRSSRIGALAASGSYWVPARADLDTALSKIDSRNVQDVLIIPGPYSSLYGPGFHFVDFELMKSPRSESGLDWHGRTSFDHNSNGNQWLGQQSFWGGGEDWGIRASYAHRTGDNYRTGNGDKVASGYESREFTIAMGRDLGDGRSIELSLLRLDQTDVAFPGYVFDIDYLVTDAYEVTYIDEHAELSDRNETEVWYNRTVFSGNAQSPGKRAQFPLLNTLSYVGVTDVDSMSTGYRRALSWGNSDDYIFTLGHDMRYIKQELNEVANATALGLPIPVTNRNSPIPRSFSVNPGLFAEYTETLFEEYTVRTGGRVDYVQTDIVDSPDKLAEVGLDFIPATYAQIVGTDQTQTDRFLWSIYGALERRYSDSLVGTASLGFAQRPPNLTELYAAQPFLLLLQNGLNNVTGDPTLDEEKAIQFDLSIDYSDETVKAGVRGFHSWAMDYITFENTQVTRGPPVGDVQQVSLRYVNTDLATFIGGEAFAELFPQSRLSPFITLKGVDGRDRTRNGDFATTNGDAFGASVKQQSSPRGFFSGIFGADAEPLPGISPFEMRMGVRLRDVREQPEWNVEFAARVVDNQDRVATSLLESPTPGFTTFDLRGIYSPNYANGLTMVGGIENLSNKAYREHLDFRSPNGIQILQPGINVYVGADWTF